MAFLILKNIIRGLLILLRFLPLLGLCLIMVET
nr:MAG TPA: hypothetical protein [Caudoviricetes sp.]